MSTAVWQTVYWLEGDRTSALELALLSDTISLPCLGVSILCGVLLTFTLPVDCLKIYIFPAKQ